MTFRNAIITSNRGGSLFKLSRLAWGASGKHYLGWNDDGTLYEVTVQVPTPSPATLNAADTAATDWMLL